MEITWTTVCRKLELEAIIVKRDNEKRREGEGDRGKDGRRGTEIDTMGSE